MSLARAVDLPILARRRAAPARLRQDGPSEIISPRNESHNGTGLPPSAGAPPDGQRTSVSQASHATSYDDHLALITSVIALICRRNPMTAAEAEDFSQEAHKKLLEGRVIERFRGRSSLRTYLITVLQNLYRDMRNREWGKFRPSVEATSAGPVAIKLEQLIVRDGLTFEEAFETLRTNYGVTVSRQTLEAMAARLPLRISRKSQSDEVLVVMPSGGASPDAIVSRHEHEATLVRVRDILREALRDLAPADRLIVKYRFVDGLPIVKIARLMNIDQKQLYRRLERIVHSLRERFADEGVDVSGLFDDEDSERE
jgi:RNA polymerase sigma factor (sigma-70 family)